VGYGSGNCQARSPIDHYERLLEEACLNHTYPIKHNLNDCDMMKNFMISGSLTRGRELDEDSGESDVMPIPRENVVMTVYDGTTLQGGVVRLT
jgi:hypothetical protein